MRVVLEDVSFAYPGSVEPLFLNFSYAFDAGTVTAVVGPSGTGKSTLLDLIGGLQLPDSGSVELHDAESSRIGPRCSWVLQNNMLLGGRTAVDNAALALIATGSPRGESRARALDALTRFGLSDRADYPPERLSGGEAQRTKMIRHLGSALTDVTYVFDEPTIGLHPHDIERMNTLLLQLRDKGNTVLVVEHDSEVMSVSFEVARPIDPERFNAWMTQLLANKGQDLLRTKGGVLPSNRQGQWGIMLAAAFVQLLRKVVPLVIKVQHLGIPHEERKRA